MSVLEIPNFFFLSEDKDGVAETNQALNLNLIRKAMLMPCKIPELDPKSIVMPLH